MAATSCDSRVPRGPVEPESGTAAVGRMRPWLLLTAIILAWCVLRGPVIYRQIPAHDEDYFAVPGWTILRDGIPRIPYMPSRNPQGAFYRADEHLFTLPPLYFYCEAAAYAVLGPGTPQARLVSALAGVAAVIVVFSLARQWFDDRAALWAAGLYAFSRVVYFPCVMTRPDMLCGAFGIATIWSMARWQRDPQRRWLAAAGGWIGLGLLTHPFTAIYAIQAGVWSLARPARLRRRLSSAALLVTVALAVFSLWLPLILQAPDTFRHQFGNNVLDRSTPGVATRFLLPWDSFRRQIPLYIEHAGALQGSLIVLVLAASTIAALRRRSETVWIPLLLAWSGIYVHVALQGRHFTKGYWCYTAALMFVVLGGAASAACRRLAALPGGRAWSLVAGVALAASFVPGSGIRTFAAHVRHWDDVNYSAPRFTRRLLAELPANRTYIVDPGYIFDFYLAGRDCRLALIYEFFYDVSDVPYDVLVAGPSSLRDEIPQALDARLASAAGDPHDLFACYAEIYTAPPDRQAHTESPP